MATERQKLSRNMNWNIRLLCGIYAQARNCSYLNTDEANCIVMICDRALERIRGENESDKRKREFLAVINEAQPKCYK